MIYLQTICLVVIRSQIIAQNEFRLTEVADLEEFNSI